MDMIRNGNWPDEDDLDVDLDESEESEIFIQEDDESDHDIDLSEFRTRQHFKAQRAAHKDYRGSRNKKRRQHRAA